MNTERKELLEALCHATRKGQHAFLEEYAVLADLLEMDPDDLYVSCTPDKAHLGLWKTAFAEGNVHAETVKAFVRSISPDICDNTHKPDISEEMAALFHKLTAPDTPDTSLAYKQFNACMADSFGDIQMVPFFAVIHHACKHALRNAERIRKDSCILPLSSIRAGYTAGLRVFFHEHLSRRPMSTFLFGHLKVAEGAVSAEDARALWSEMYPGGIKDVDAANPDNLQSWDEVLTEIEAAGLAKIKDGVLKIPFICRMVFDFK